MSTTCFAESARTQSILPYKLFSLGSKEINRINSNLRSQLGLRINPVVGGGSIALVSTATRLSKFGVPVTEETRERVVELYRRNTWLTGIHVHVGSQVI